MKKIQGIDPKPVVKPEPNLIPLYGLAINPKQKNSILLDPINKMPALQKAGEEKSQPPPDITSTSKNYSSRRLINTSMNENRREPYQNGVAQNYFLKQKSLSSEVINTEEYHTTKEMVKTQQSNQKSKREQLESRSSDEESSQHKQQLSRLLEVKRQQRNFNSSVKENQRQLHTTTCNKFKETEALAISPLVMQA